ncbi:winged helix-turn-helix domain-containing protein [Streptosporangium sp. NPDC051022]|uniref:helix-turn-helix domain-containing protein n=1 Tax=Streptosporangium sp. NPDC051022 TaxID=3155752 RepID=UPI00344388EF
MRYAEGGGLTAAERARREQLRFEAAGLFAQGVPAPEVARRFRVSRMSVNRWYRAWQAGGQEALAFKGPGGEKCRLDERRLERLRAELERGPAAHGYLEDQRWTPARVADLISVLFHIRYTLRKVSYLLHRLGWTPQIPVQRAVERGEGVIEQWVAEEWPAIKGRRSTWAPGCAGPTSAGRT